MRSWQLEASRSSQWPRPDLGLVVLGQSALVLVLVLVCHSLEVVLVVSDFAQKLMGQVLLWLQGGQRTFAKAHAALAECWLAD